MGRKKQRPRFALLLTVLATGLAAAVASLAAAQQQAAPKKTAPAAVTGAAPTWQPAGWGGGGLYWAVAFHPTQRGVIYMGGDVAGVYKTEDDGKHWRLINQGLTNYAVYSLAVSRNAPNVVYAGTTGGFCKSVDAGEHWRLLPETTKARLGITAERNKSVRALAIDPTNSNILYAGTPSGKVYRSDDGGENWKMLYQTPPSGSVLSVAVAARGSVTTVLAATTNDGIQQSTDGGATWKRAEAPLDATAVAVAASDPNTLYAGFGKEGAYRSTDGGKTWTPCEVKIDSKTRIVEIAVSPLNPKAVSFIATNGWAGRFYASNDGGTTCALVTHMKADATANPTIADNPDFLKNGTSDLSKPTNLAIDPTDPSRMFIAANWRPCFSADYGKTWEERDRGADISVVYDIRFSGPRTYVSVMDEGVLASEDRGKNWRQLWPRVYNPEIAGHNWRLALWNKNGTDRVLSTCSPWDRPGDLVVVSEDGGKTFTTSRQGLPDKRPKANTMWGEGYLRALATDPKNPDVLYAGMDGDPASDGTGGGGIFRSEDGGKTWKALPAQPPTRRMFFALAVDPTDSNRLYWGACGNNGGLYRSDDAGAHWTRIFDKETWIFNLLVTPQGTIYCPGKNLWRSTDHGQTWTQITNNDKASQIVGLECDPRNDKVVWASFITWGEDAQGSVQRTTDGGKTWTEITSDLPYRKPLILRFNPATNELWAGGVGLFKKDESAVVSGGTSVLQGSSLPKSR